MLTPASPAAGKPLHPAAIKEIEGLLQTTQRILNNMATDERKDSWQYRSIEARYKSLSAKLGMLRQKQAEQARQARPSSGPLGSVPRGPYGASRPVGYGAPGARPPGQAAGPMPTRPAAGSLPARPGAATAYGRPAGVPPRPLGAAPAGMPRPAGAPALALPKFTASLGPAGRPGIISQGMEIENLQKLLTHLGYETPLSGTFDAATAKAVHAFQRDKGLLPNGLVGLQMRQMLNQMVVG